MKSDKVVIFRLGSIGDTIVALPCFHAVRSAYPLAEITLLTNFPISSKAAPMLELLGMDAGIVNNAMNYTLGLRNPLEALQIIVKLRQLGSKTLIYMRSQPSLFMILRDKLFFRLCGFKNILCVPRNFDERVSRVDEDTNTVEPEASRLARCFSSFGLIDLNDRASWNLCFSNTEICAGKNLAEKIPSPFLAIHMGGKVADNDWGLERWISFLREFKIHSGAKGLAIIGSKDDSRRASILAETWGDGAVNFCGRTSPREVASFLLNAQMFVGHDSGPLHLTQCTATPALGIFGSYNRPKKWHPIGSHIQVIHEMNGISQITVDQVVAKALAIWSRLE